MRKYCVECGEPLDPAFRGTTDYARRQMRYCSTECKQRHKNRNYYAAHRDEIKTRVARNKRTTRVAQSRAAGYVYIVHCADLYKIGATRNAKQRIARFETAYPHELRVIRVSRVHDMTSVEKSLHTRFAAKRVKGEWFNLNSNDLRVIARLLPNAQGVK